METTYKILKKDKDPLKQTIEKEFVAKNSFTLQEVQNHIADLEKKAREHEGAAKIAIVRKNALLNEFPALKKMKPEMVDAAYRYSEVLFDVDQYSKSSKIARKAIKEYKKEVEDIKSALGIE